MDKNREAFEAWISRAFPRLTPSDERYEVAKITWKAARQAIEVELDEPYDDGHGNEWLPKDSTIKAITSLGIRVKGNEE